MFFVFSVNFSIKKNRKTHFLAKVCPKQEEGNRRNVHRLARIFLPAGKILAYHQRYLKDNGVVKFPQIQPG